MLHDFGLQSVSLPGGVCNPWSRPGDEARPVGIGYGSGSTSRSCRCRNGVREKKEGREDIRSFSFAVENAKHPVILHLSN